MCSLLSDNLDFDLDPDFDFDVDFDLDKSVLSAAVLHTEPRLHPPACVSIGHVQNLFSVGTPGAHTRSRVHRYSGGDDCALDHRVHAHPDADAYADADAHPDADMQDLYYDGHDYDHDYDYTHDYDYDHDAVSLRGCVDDL